MIMYVYKVDLDLAPLTLSEKQQITRSYRHYCDLRQVVTIAGNSAGQAPWSLCSAAQAKQLLVLSDRLNVRWPSFKPVLTLNLQHSWRDFRPTLEGFPHSCLECLRCLVRFR